MIKSRKFFRAILAMLAVLLIAWLVVWYINCSEYKIYTARNYEKLDNCYIKEANGLCYTISCPTIESLVGNYAITNHDDSISIIIWPKYIGHTTYTFGLQIKDRETGTGYMVYVNDKMKYLEESNNSFTSTETEHIRELIKRRGSRQ